MRLAPGKDDGVMLRLAQVLMRLGQQRVLHPAIEMEEAEKGAERELVGEHRGEGAGRIDIDPILEEADQITGKVEGENPPIPLRRDAVGLHHAFDQIENRSRRSAFLLQKRARRVASQRADRGKTPQLLFIEFGRLHPLGA